MVLFFFALPNSLMAQAPFPYPHPYVYYHHDRFSQFTYSVDGRSMLYFPYGFPGEWGRHNYNPYRGINFRWAAPYPLVYEAPSVNQASGQLNFQGPYWTYGYFRRHRGLFRRSSWQWAWVPYYSAPLTNAAVPPGPGASFSPPTSGLMPPPAQFSPPVLPPPALPVSSVLPDH